MPMMSDLVELKTILEIDPNNHGEDTKLLLYLTITSEWISEILNRPGLFLKSRTEFYDGHNTQMLLLHSRPVYTDPLPRCWVDSGGYWGQTSGGFAENTELTYGTDFLIKADQEDQSSRSGILYRRKGAWPKFHARQVGWLTPFTLPGPGNIKVTYSGGYTIDSLPAQLRFGCNLLASKMRSLMPGGMEMQSESFEDRSVSLIGDRKDYLLATVKDLVLGFRNWRW